MNDVPAPIPTNPGAFPLRKAKHESFARNRALGMPPLAAARAAGYPIMTAGNAAKLDRNLLIRARISELTRQDAEIVKAKAEAISQFYMSVLVHDPADIWEKVEITRKDGSTFATDRARCISDLAPETRMVIESVRLTENGWIEPKVYSKMAAAEALRKQHGIGVAMRDGDDEMSRMSDEDIKTEVRRLARLLGKELIGGMQDAYAGLDSVVNDRADLP